MIAPKIPRGHGMALAVGQEVVGLPDDILGGMAALRCCPVGARLYRRSDGALLAYRIGTAAVGRRADQTDRRRRTN